MHLHPGPGAAGRGGRLGASYVSQLRETSAPGRHLRRRAEARRASFGKSSLRSHEESGCERGGGTSCVSSPAHVCLGGMNGRRPGRAPVGSVRVGRCLGLGRGARRLWGGEGEGPAGKGSVEDAGPPVVWCRCGQGAGAGLRGAWPGSAAWVHSLSSLPPSQGVSAAQVSSCFFSGWELVGNLGPPQQDGPAGSTQGGEQSSSAAHPRPLAVPEFSG